jgi:ketosteroid isomerase-like protein
MEGSRQQRNVDLARRGMEAYNRGDIEAVLELFSPEMELYSPPDFINAGVFHGREGWLKWSGQWNEAWGSFDIQVERVEPVGERFVLLNAHQVGRGRGSGVSVEQDVVYVYEITDEGCVYMAIHPDRERTLADIRRREETSA